MVPSISTMNTSFKLLIFFVLQLFSQFIHTAFPLRFLQIYNNSLGLSLIHFNPDSFMNYVHSSVWANRRITIKYFSFYSIVRVFAGLNAIPWQNFGLLFNMIAISRKNLSRFVFALECHYISFIWTVIINLLRTSVRFCIWVGFFARLREFVLRAPMPCGGVCLGAIPGFHENSRAHTHVCPTLDNHCTRNC